MPRMSTWSAAAMALAALIAPTWLVAQVPATHTVREGDTLWDLAKKYRGDPFLWPDIYRLNTAVVEDPHWIYPGEVLRLTGGDSVTAVPTTDTPPASVVTAPTNPSAPSASGAPAGQGDTMQVASNAPRGNPEFTGSEPGDSNYKPLFSTGSTQTINETLRAYTDQPYHPLRRNEFYSSGFLTEGQTLPLGTLLGSVTPSQIRTLSNREVAMLYTRVGVQPPRGVTYQVGDSLLVVQLGAEVEGYGQVVSPVGLARVTEATDGRYVAVIEAVYGAIRQGQYVLPAEKFTPSAAKNRAKRITDGVRGHVLGGKGRQELKAPQMVVFIDKGRKDGVAPGDLFEARRQPRQLADGSLRIDDVMAEFQIVRVGERSATARILNVMSPDLPPGTEVRQVAKLP